MKLVENRGAVPVRTRYVILNHVSYVALKGTFCSSVLNNACMLSVASVCVVSTSTVLPCTHSLCGEAQQELHRWSEKKARGACRCHQRWC